MGIFSGLIIASLLLVPLSCEEPSSESQVNADEEFLLREQQRISIIDTDLTIEIKQIIDGLDGSQEIGVGAVYITIESEGGEPQEIYLETGGSKQFGEYEILLI